jgi:hypothetical protein
VLVALAIAVLGSGNLRWFDAALIGYLFGTLFAIFAVVYCYLVWLRRPPTARLNRRGWEAFRRPGHRGRNALAFPGLIVSSLLVQSFIRSRSRTRWVAHQLVFWGCVLAALVTFPLVFGLLHFESVGQDGRRYRTFISHVGTLTLDSRSVAGWVTFHLLDIAAVLVLAGVFIFCPGDCETPVHLRWSGRATSSPWPGSSLCPSPGWHSPHRTCGWKAASTCS